MSGRKSDPDVRASGFANPELLRSGAGLYSWVVEADHRNLLSAALLEHSPCAGLFCWVLHTAVLVPLAVRLGDDILFPFRAAEIVGPP